MAGLVSGGISEDHGPRDGSESRLMLHGTPEKGSVSSAGLAGKGPAQNLRHVCCAARQDSQRQAVAAPGLTLTGEHQSPPAHYDLN